MQHVPDIVVHLDDHMLGLVEGELDCPSVDSGADVVGVRAYLCCVDWGVVVGHQNLNGTAEVECRDRRVMKDFGAGRDVCLGDGEQKGVDGVVLRMATVQGADADRVCISTCDSGRDWMNRNWSGGIARERCSKGKMGNSCRSPNNGSEHFHCYLTLCFVGKYYKFI